MGNYDIELFKEVRCPICGKKIRISDLPKPMENLAKVAIDHGKHVVVIKYDKFGYVRTIETYKVKNEDNRINSVISEKCPRCDEKIPIIEVNDYPFEYAYKHRDHVVIINMLEKDFYFTEIYTLIEEKNVKVSLDLSPIDELIEKTDEKTFATILALIAMKKDVTISVPNKIYSAVNNLLKLYGIRGIHVVKGDITKLEKEYFEFFLRLIKTNEKKPEKLEEKYKATLLLIDKVINLLKETINKKRYGKQVQSLITKLEQKGLWGIVKYRLMREYPPEIIAPIV